MQFPCESPFHVLSIHTSSSLRCRSLLPLRLQRFQRMQVGAMWRSLLLGLACSLVHTGATCHETDAQQPLGPVLSTDRRPNIVFILTDDQDLHMHSLSYMPLVKKHLLDEGTFYRRHYCTIALCCPSRVSLWTGRAAHNTNVTDVNPPYGWSFTLKSNVEYLMIF